MLRLPRTGDPPRRAAVARLSTEQYCQRCKPPARTRCWTAGCQRLAIVGEDSCRQCINDGRGWEEALTARALGAEPALAGIEGEDRERVAAAAASALSANTRASYAAQWAGFAAWCDARRIAPLEAAPPQVAAFLAARAETAKTATVRSAAAAIAAAFRAADLPDPTKTALVGKTLRGVARQHAAEPAAAPRPAAPLGYSAALQLMAAAAHPPPQRRGRGDEDPPVTAARGRRDAAIIALGFCAGLRRSEIARLRWDDVTPAGEGELRVAVRASKTNPFGDREDHRLLVGPFAEALERLRRDRDPDEERVVPIGPHQVNDRVRRLAARAGLEGVTSHSGRRGLATELIRRGASTTSVQLAGGWRTPAMVLRYAASVTVEDGAVARHLR